MKKSGLVVKSYTLYHPNKNILLYHSFKFNEQQNKAVNREIMKYRKKSVRAAEVSFFWDAIPGWIKK